MAAFLSVSGTIISIENAPSAPDTPSYCSLMIGLENTARELTYFIIQPDTCFTGWFTLKRGDYITAFYDANAPAILIYPPRYTAVVISKNFHNLFLKVDYFNEDLISSDNMLKLNIGPRTRIFLPNHQNYLGKLGNQNLAVMYKISTKSIPAQTTPYEIIVLCYPKLNS